MVSVVSESIRFEFKISPISDQVAEYKKIKGVFFIDEFPVTISGKIIRRKLKETGEVLLRQSKPQLFYPYE